MDFKFGIDALERLMAVRAHEDAGGEWQRNATDQPARKTIGQEASVVALALSVAADDALVASRRNLDRLRAARSAKPVAVDQGIFESIASPGDEITCATEIALARREAGQSGLTISLFGDDTLDERRLGDSIVEAALLHLPILYVWESDDWTTFVHRREIFLNDRISSHAARFGIVGASVDGGDVAAVLRALQAARRYIAWSGRPYLLEAATDRRQLLQHGGETPTRDPASLLKGGSGNPIARLAARLLDGGALDDGALAAMERRVTARIADSRAPAQTPEAPVRRSA